MKNLTNLTILLNCLKKSLFNNKNNRKKYPYSNLSDVFYDYYHGNGIKHNSSYDKEFNCGDVVTTGCGWDLGIHSGIEGIVYARIERYSPGGIYGRGDVEWYKTGVNVTMKEWGEMCASYLNYKDI